MDKDSYNILRKKIRAHILLSSRVVESKRMAFERLSVIMGGLVVKKTVMTECISGNEGVRISSLMEGSEDMVALQRSSLQVLGRARQFELEIFDCSGLFTAGCFLEDQTKDLRVKLEKIREGDLVFIEGEVVPLNSSEGYFLLANQIFDSDELELLEITDPEHLRILKEEVDTAKACRSEPSLNDQLSLGRTPMDVVRIFLQNAPGLEVEDNYWLANVTFRMFLKKPSFKSAKLVRKFFNRQCFGELGDNSDQTMLKIYPSLKNYL